MANRNMQQKIRKLKRQLRMLPADLPGNYPLHGNPKGIAYGYREDNAKYDGVPAGRFEVLQHLEYLRRQLVTAMHFVYLIKNDDEIVQLFYNSERTAFIILEVNVLHNTTRSSMKYTNRDFLVSLWQRDREKVRWFSFAPLHRPVSE